MEFFKSMFSRAQGNTVMVLRFASVLRHLINTHHESSRVLCTTGLNIVESILGGLGDEES